MALMNCETCGSEVSSHAERCPKCDTSLSQNSVQSVGSAAEPVALTPELKDAIDKIMSAKNRTFTFMLAGRTGVGKSSTINSLLCKEVAPVGSLRPTTFSVTRFSTTLGDFAFDVVDTPGLCDGLDDEDGVERDSMYLEKMRAETKQIDSLWFVTKLNETRVSRDEKDAIRLLTKAFTPDVWKRAVIVFTYANSPDIGLPYKEWLQERTSLLREAIAKHVTPEVASRIPTVAIDNRSSTTPDGMPWKGELFTQTFETTSKEGLLSLALGTQSLIRRSEEESSSRRYSSQNEHWNSQPIELSGQQESRIAGRLQSDDSTKRVFAAAAIGAGYGAILGGPIGAAVGGTIGAAVGYFSKWFK